MIVDALDFGLVPETNHPKLEQSQKWADFFAQLAGGEGVFRRGPDGAGTYWWDPNKVTLAFPQCQTAKLSMPENGRPGPAYLQAVKLQPLHDLPDGVMYDTVPFLDVGTVARPYFENFCAKGPTTYSSPDGHQGGMVPCRLGGLGLNGSFSFEGLAIEGFSSSILEGGSGRGFDHQSMMRGYLDGAGMGYNFLPGSNAAGDQRFWAIDINANCAGIAMAASASSGEVGGNYQGFGIYSPGPAIYRYDDGTTQQGGQFSSNVLGSLSAEFCVDGVFFDQMFDQPNGVSVGDNNWLQGFYESPRPDNGWGKDMAVTAYNVDATGRVQITVNNTPGFRFDWNSMAVYDPTLPPAQRKELAIIKSVDTVWPHASGATLTLSAALPPAMVTSFSSNGQVHINIRKLGTLVAGSIGDETVGGSLARTGFGFPFFYSGRTNTQNCKITDGSTAWACAKLGPLLGGKVGTGNVWGDRGVRGASGAMAVQKACQAGDLLMGNDNGLMLADGTRRLRGWAMRDAAAFGDSHAVHGSPVDVQFQGGGGKNAICPITARNHTTTDIPALAMVKLDPVNPGGIAPAADKNDGVIATTFTVIPAGGTGQLLESRLTG